jgi:phosphinothricin acetyltransferase
MLLRDARLDDLASIDTIHDHYVATSSCTYQLEPAGLAARVAWFEGHGPRHPILVAVDERGGVAGWGSLSPFNLRGGYARTVEDSVYVRHDRRGAGVGRALLAELLDRAIALDHHAVIAGVDAAQDASLALHARFGFREVGRLREVGFKLGAFRDVVYLQRLLG